MWMQATGAVCTVAATGKGFRITAAKVVPVNVNGPGPYPPCTRPALTAALLRGLNKRTLAPSHFSRGWVCAGDYARGDYIDVHGGIGDDIVVLFRAKGRQWQLISRGGATCVNGKLPAPVYIACTVD
jgi:hypothetical protein